MESSKLTAILHLNLPRRFFGQIAARTKRAASVNAKILGIKNADCD